MTRSERLLQLMQLLRVYRQPVSAGKLAGELEVSVRTVYRDIATLQAQGADIDGAPGIGYQLRPGFMLPPMMFSREEIEALVLGSRWVAARTDSRLSFAAENAIAKISAVLPADLRDQLDEISLMVPRTGQLPENDRMLRRVREALRSEIKVRIAYTDQNGAASQRTVWPIAVGFFEEIRVMVAWCELRMDFRHFRLDRIGHLELTADPIPQPREKLRREWRTQLGIHPSSITGNSAKDTDRN